MITKDRASGLQRDVGRCLTPLGLALLLGTSTALASESPLQAPSSLVHADLAAALVPTVPDEVLHVAQADAAEDAVWALIKDSGDPEVFLRFIEQYPDSQHVPEASSKLAALTDQGGDIEAPSSESLAPITEAAVEQALALAMQTELQRLGCYTGALDGNWGPGSRSALGDFASQTGFDIGSHGPNDALLQMLKLKRDVVCVPKRDTGAAQAGECVQVKVAVDALDYNNDVWDWKINGNPEPDIIVTERSTGASASCPDSFRCSLNIPNSPASLSLQIIDEDTFSTDQVIGDGMCSATKGCRMRSATVTIGHC